MADEEEEEANIDRFAKQCTLFILSQHCKNATIKRSDLIKTVIPDQSRKSSKLILDKTKYLLKKIHGLTLVELNENIKQYIVINEIEPDEIPLKWSDKIRKQQALLLPILSFIFMNGGTATENEIKTLLRKLKILNNLNQESETFGNVIDILKKDFVSQRYLSFSIDKIQNNDQEELVGKYKWGVRAKLEVKKNKILQFVSDLYGVDISHWSEQYAQLKT